MNISEVGYQYLCLIANLVCSVCSLHLRIVRSYYSALLLLCVEVFVNSFGEFADERDHAYSTMFAQLVRLGVTPATT